MALTPEELEEIRRLHVIAGRRVDSLFAGEYRSAIRGQGMEFEEVRLYQPGDDIRHIDWNVTARSSQPFIKTFREERELTVILVVDVSGSTTVGSGGRDGRTDRHRQMARIAGGLAYASLRNRDKVGLLTFSDKVETFLPPRKSRGYAWGVIQEVFAPSRASKRTDLTHALKEIGARTRRRSAILVISDFMDDGPWAQAMLSLAQRHDVHAIHVADPMDTSLQGLGLVEVEDAETGKRRLVDAATWAAASQAQETMGTLQELGIHAVSIDTQEDPFRALHHWFASGKKR